MWWRNAPILVLIAALAGGCGFQPLYGTPSREAGQVTQLSQIEILPAQNRVTQVVRNELLDRLSPRGAPAKPTYTLSLGVTESETAVLITRADVVTRFNLLVTGNYVLSEKDSGKVLMRGSVSAFSAYNVVQSDFANVTAQDTARRNAGRDVADQLRERLAGYFKRGT